MLTGERAFRAGMYYRTADGFLAELTSPLVGGQVAGRWRYDVGFFNPGSNTAKVSMLRLANPADSAAEVVVAGLDDAGREAPGGTVTVTLPSQGATTLTAPVLETGGNGLTGRLGDGEGKWRLTVTADRPVMVMSLLHATQTGHLANLSAIEQGAEGSAPPSGTPDLVVESSAVSATDLIAGAAFTFTARVRNQGHAPSAATTLRYYRSADGTISASDTAVGTDAIGSLSASATRDGSISLTAPSAPGTYYYGACVDAVAGEADAANNCSSAVRATIVGGGPTDDHGDTPATATHVQAGSTTAGRLEARGDKDYFRFTLPQSRRLQVRTTGRTITYGTLYRGDTVVASDDDGGDYPNFSITIPSAQAGTYYVEVKGDYSWTTGAYSLRVEVSDATAPDLALADAEVYIYTYSPTGRWSMDVHNIGDADSPGTTARVSTRGQEFDTDEISGYSLRAGSISGWAYGRFSTLAANTPRVGDTVTFCVDAVPYEQNTANNCMTARATCFIGCRGEAGSPANAAEEAKAAAEAMRALEARRARLRALEESAGRAKQVR